MLTVLVSTKSDSQANATHIFSIKNISEYAIFNDQSFNDTLTNDIVSFEQLGPVLYQTQSKYREYRQTKRNCNRIFQQ